MLSYDEAEKYAMTVPWKYKKCSQHRCWCGQVVLKNRIQFKESNGANGYFTTVIREGYIPKEYAQHLVKTHNFYIEFNK